MKTVTERIRERLERGLPRRKPSLDELRRGQWSRDFERLMRNRLIMGAMRYETMAEKHHNGNGYDIAGSVVRRMESYRKDGNIEHLIDVANLCMIEFETPSHPRPVFMPTDDGQHVEKK